MSLIIDETTYNIPVESIKRKADFLFKYAERTEDGNLHSELIGVYFNYELQLGKTTDTSAYNALWAKLTEPTEYHSVTVPDEWGGVEFNAYFVGVADEIRHVAGAINYWKNLTVNFIAMDPARTP